jgi:hypothetical protein
MNEGNVTRMQKIEYGRGSLWAPFYTDGMTARIQGRVPHGLLAASLQKLKVLHPILASRVIMNDRGNAWLTSEGVGEFPLEVCEMNTDGDWQKVLLRHERLPFNMEQGPLARFILLQGEPSSDLVLVCPHVVCDAYSMTIILSDLVTLMNDPAREVVQPLPSPVVSWETMPHPAWYYFFTRGAVGMFNLAWRKRGMILDQEKYEELHRQYWPRQDQGWLVFNIPPAVTAKFVSRCRNQGVSVTSAFVAAFLLAQLEVHVKGNANRYVISMAASIRDRLVEPPGRRTGMYGTSFLLGLHVRSGTSYWDLARTCHRRLHRVLENRTAFLGPLVVEEIHPLFMDAYVSALSTGQLDRGFDLPARLMRVKGETRRFDVSNIGRVALAEVGSPYKVETIFPFPPFLPGAALSLCTLTAGEQLQGILRFNGNDIPSAVAAAIKERALNFLKEE